MSQGDGTTPGDKTTRTWLEWLGFGKRTPSNAGQSQPQITRDGDAEEQIRAGMSVIMAIRGVAATAEERQALHRLYTLLDETLLEVQQKKLAALGEKAIDELKLGAQLKAASGDFKKTQKKAEQLASSLNIGSDTLGMFDKLVAALR